MSAWQTLLRQLDEGRFAPSDDFPDRTRVFVYGVSNSVQAGRLSAEEAATTWLYHLPPLGFPGLLDPHDLAQITHAKAAQWESKTSTKLDRLDTPDWVEGSATNCGPIGRGVEAL